MAQLTLQQAFELAVQHHQAGRLRDAAQLYQQLLAKVPGHIDAMHNLGIATLQMGNNEAAAALFHRVIVADPGLVEAHCNLGNALMRSGQLDASIASYRRAIGLRANYSEAMINLGVALKEKGEFDEAIAFLRQAINLSPGYPAAHSNLGNALRGKGELDEAIAAYRLAISLDPAYSDAHSNLGSALKDKGQLDEAISAYKRAITLNPNSPQGHNNLGNALKDRGELDQAIKAYRQAVRLAPANAGFDSNLCYTLHFDPASDAKSLAEEHSRWSQQHAQPLAKFIQSHSNDPDPDRRLRIGYVSPNFAQHPVGLAMLPLLDAHDHSCFQITCYSDVGGPDSITDQCRNAADQWRNIAGHSDEQVTELIRQDRIDILVDLVSHMAGNRLLVFARKPAPVQVTFLGHQSTTGMGAMGYRISDPYLDPPGPDDFYYSEKIIRLPDCYLVFQPPLVSPPVEPSPVLRSGHITFGSLNNLCKVNPRVLERWSRILTEIPDSRLILRCPAGETQQRVLNVLAQRGIQSTRLTLCTEWLGAKEYLELHHGIDIYLDTFPHAGHTTSLDALWMGVPLITLAGRTAVGRGGVFLLANLGLNELIAQNEQEYFEKAVGLARDLPKLQELRSRLRSRMEQSPLMDAPKYARNVEAAYRQMWRNWCQVVSAVAPRPDFALKEQPEKAIVVPQQTTTPQPDHAQAHYELGISLQSKGQLDQAVAAYRQAVALGLRSAEVHNNLGVALRDLGQTDEANASCRQAITMNPSLPEAHTNLGNALRDRGQLDESIASYLQAIALRPESPEAFNNLGSALKDKGQLEDATAAYRRAIALRPSYAEAHCNLGVALHGTAPTDEVIAVLRQAIALQPGYADAHYNLGIALHDNAQLDDAIAAYEQAIALRPDFAEAHSNLSFVLLQKQNYPPGWREYEWRLKARGGLSPHWNFPQPRWDGSDLNNRTIVLDTEQGFGDTIQFIRYVPLVARRGGRVIVECPSELQRLLQYGARGWEVITRGQPLPAFDVHCPLLSLPLVFGTTAQSIPAQVPYLHCDPHLAAKWREKLARLPESRNVGLVWAGSPSFKNDKARSPRQLSLFSPLAEVKNVRLFSLQKGEAAKQAVNAPRGMPLIDWSNELYDFADTAALIANLDLVICSDTSVAHLAGALGKPVWVILPYVPDWRWLLGREDCAWYPSMRLFRQTKRADWHDVLRRVSDSLKGFAAEGPSYREEKLPRLD